MNQSERMSNFRKWKQFLSWKNWRYWA